MCLNLVSVPTTKKQQEIVMATYLVKRHVPLDKPPPEDTLVERHTSIAKPSSGTLPYDIGSKLMEKCKQHPNERALLSYLLAMINKVDPDVIMGHDLVGFEVDFLLHRLVHNKVPLWSRISRLKRAHVPKFMSSKAALAEAVAGRLYADSKLITKELFRARSYDLTELTKQILRKSREDIVPTAIMQYFNQSNTLNELIKWSCMDASYSLNILFQLNALPLFLHITQIVGGIMSRTLMGGRSERNEYLLLHAFYEKEYIRPDKMSWKKRNTQTNPSKQTTAEHEGEEEGEDGGVSKKKASYAGGLVLEPKKGLYDSFILLLDFNSLYPSIIQEYNICFTTIQQSSGNEDGIPNLPQSTLGPGILPTEIRKLVESRKEVKKLMKQGKVTAVKMAQYNIRQLGLKLTANSMYGCLGFGHSRFYAKPLAALVTAKGREILMHTKELVEKQGLEVIYGDTDSIMINTNSTDFEEVMELGRKMKNEVNKLYRLLELDIDGVYKRLLLLKKKKYAGLAVERQLDGKMTFKRELKGLDIVRRDWSQLAKEAGEQVVNEILSDQTCETTVEKIHDFLTAYAAKIRAGDVALEKFEISKQLTKAPTEYPDKGQPHVSVALRMQTEGNYHFGQGDTVPYVICQDGSGKAATQRAYHPKELQTKKDLVIDTDYYLSQQIHPVVSRLCDPIEGTDAMRIAECLGMDPSSYRRNTAYVGTEEEDEYDFKGPGLDFSNAVPFSFPCISPKCDEEIRISAPLLGETGKQEFSLGKCPNVKCDLNKEETKFSYASKGLNYVKNQLELTLRNTVNVYYLKWLICDDSMCGFRGRRIPLRSTKEGRPVCPSCRRGSMSQEITEKDLLTQLTYYRQCFELTKENVDDINKRLTAVGARSGINANEQLVQMVDRKLSLNRYSLIDLGKVFEMLLPAKLKSELAA